MDIQFLSTSTVLVLLLVGFILTTSLIHVLGPQYDPREPPVIPQRIPYVGHLIGLIRYGHSYLEHLSKNNKLPIYTIQTLNKRTYVINSPELVVAVQKNTRTLSFNPFIIAMSPRMFNVDKRDHEIVALNNDSRDGHWGLVPEIHNGTYSILAPGTELDDMIRTMVEKMNPFLDHLEADEGGAEVELYGWFRGTMSVASTEAVYGPENPFTHEPGLVQAFWDYEKDLTKLILGLFPSYIASNGYRARQQISAAMQSYFLRNGQDQASGLLKLRYEISKRHDLSLEGISTFELGDCIGVLINATPLTFWMLFHIYSSSSLLSHLRDEITNVVSESTHQNNDRKRRTFSIDIGELKTRCPLLFSTYQEVLRVQTHNASARWVLADTLLLDRYLLKADNIIQMPGHVVHANPSLWGSDVDIFNPRRFIKHDAQFKGKNDATHSIKPGSFRAFGGGATLCPGRHFATTEIISVVAMVVMRFDITPLDPAGWVQPNFASGKVASSIPPPASDITVRVTKREEYRDARWEFGGSGEGNTAGFEVA